MFIGENIKFDNSTDDETRKIRETSEVGELSQLIKVEEKQQK